MLAAVTAGFILSIVGVGAPAALADTKPYAADITPHLTPSGTTTTFSLKLTNENPPGSGQKLGSANLTAPAGFTLVSATATPGTARIVGSVIQFRNIDIAAATSRSMIVTATTATADGVYVWGISAKQSNDYNGVGNDLTLNAVHSNLSTTVSGNCCIDLSVSQTDSPDPVAPSGSVNYSITASNAGPKSSTITVTDSVNAGSVSAAYGSGWTCSITGSSAACSYGTVGSGGQAAPLSIIVDAPSSAGTVTCGSTTAAGAMCNTATVSGSQLDSNSANDTSYETTSLGAPNNSASGYVYEPKGGSVTLPTVVTPGTPSQTVGGTATFPGINATGGFIFTINAPASPSMLCPVNGLATQCTFELGLLSNAANGGIPAEYSDPSKPVDVSIFCGVATCSGITGYTLYKQDGTPRALGEPLGPCGLGQFPCLVSDTRDALGNHTFLTRWLGGDPQVMGKCIPGACTI